MKTRHLFIYNGCLSKTWENMMLKQIGVVMSIFTVFSLPVLADADNISVLSQLANAKHRSAANIQRNTARHPAETLDFFGINETMNVTELWPVKGWYTEILGPYLKDSGQLTIANFKTITSGDDKKANYYAKLGRKLSNRINHNPEVFGSVIEIPYDPEVDGSFGMPQSQDMVLAFRHVHNWDADGVFKDVMKAAFSVLKSGGVLGIVEHKADQLSDMSASAVRGYTDESYVIKVIESIGFKLDGRSGINANPKDSKNYPKGVFALPPTLAMGALERDKYLAIGESDRMTLKFVKP
jgi:predicted methyltransferase